MNGLHVSIKKDGSGPLSLTLFSESLVVQLTSLFTLHLQSPLHLTSSKSVFESFEQVSWYRPVDLPSLLELKHAHPTAKLIVGNTEVAMFNCLKVRLYCGMFGCLKLGISYQLPLSRTLWNVRMFECYLIIMRRDCMLDCFVCLKMFEYFTNLHLNNFL